MTADPGEARPAAAWELGRIEAALAGWLTRAGEPAATPPPAAGGAAGDALRRPDERLARLQARLDETQRQADAADAELAAADDALRRWLDGLAAVRRRLEEGTARAA
jgi:hypothetical protein